MTPCLHQRFLDHIIDIVLRNASTRNLAREARASLRHSVARDSRNWMAWLDLAGASSGAAARAAFAHAQRLNPLGQDVQVFQETFLGGKP